MNKIITDDFFVNNDVIYDISDQIPRYNTRIKNKFMPYAVSYIYACEALLNDANFTYKKVIETDDKISLSYLGKNLRRNYTFDPILLRKVMCNGWYLFLKENKKNIETCLPFDKYISNFKSNSLLDEVLCEVIKYL